MIRGSGVSVVIPSYNHARYLPEAIQSALGQSVPPDEVIVVDDGSSDGSLDILRGFGDAIRLLPQENRGAPAALNRGIDVSRGSWIAILNSDDLFEPSRIEQALGLAGATGADMVLGRVRLIDGGGAQLGPEAPTAEWYRRVLEERNGRPLATWAREHNFAVTTSNFFMSRELWERVGGFSSYRYVHDYAFLLEALAVSAPRVVFEPSLVGVRYRVHGANTIAEDPEGALAQRAVMLSDHRGFLRKVRRRLLPRRVRSDPARYSTYAVRETAVGRSTMKCGLVASTLDRGGLEEMVAMLASTLPSMGVETSVLCTGEAGEVGRRLRGAGIPVTVAEGRERPITQWLASSMDVLSTHHVSVDVARILAQAGVPMVDTIHNTFAWYDDEAWRRERDKCALMTHLVHVSDFVAEYHGRAAGTGLGSTVIGNGVVGARVPEIPKSAARRLLDIDADAVVFAHVGRFCHQKNQVGLLDAFEPILAERADVRLLLVGAGGDTSYEREVARKAADMTGTGRLRVVPYTPSVGAVLSAADAFVSNAFYDGWSLAATEALWIGRPVILSDGGSARALVGPASQRGFVIPGAAGDPLLLSPDRMRAPDPEAVLCNRNGLRAATESVVADVAMWRERAPDIRSFARANWAATRVAADYARVFSRVVRSVGDDRSNREGS